MNKFDVDEAVFRILDSIMPHIKNAIAMELLSLETGEPGTVVESDEEAFLRLLTTYQRGGGVVGPAQGRSYAPSVLAKQPDARQVTSKRLAAAMSRLMVAGAIEAFEEGPPSRRRKYIRKAATNA